MAEDKNTKSVAHYFKELEKDPDIPFAIAAVNTMLHFLKIYTAETMIDLQKRMREVVKELIEQNLSMSVASGCELFVRFITMASMEQPNFKECKDMLIKRGEKFIGRCLSARKEICHIGHKFIKNGSRILFHGRSRVVLGLLMAALSNKKYFEVYVTTGAPEASGHEMKQKLQAIGIPTTLVLDSAVGFIMERIDAIFVGAEGVVESGGIINQMGTYQIAVMAQYLGVPLYVAVESYKFIRYYPLKQIDIPNVNKYLPSSDEDSSKHPKIDYTPPGLINFLITDLGILTPSGVSDELIKLYM